MIFTENEKRWSNIISEELHVQDANKVQWMSKYAQIHELHESVQNNTMNVSHGLYSTPLNTIGMGSPMMPVGGPDSTTPGGAYTANGYSQNGAFFGGNANGQTGSGDIPMSTLPMALEIAAMTVGFELVPVIPANGPWTMLSYLDFPYAGGKLGRLNETTMDGKGPENENKPIYIKFPANMNGKATPGNIVCVGLDDSGALKTGNDYLSGTVIGYSRIDNSLIVKVLNIGNGNLTVKGATTDDGVNKSIADIFATAQGIYEYAPTALTTVVHSQVVDPSTPVLGIHADLVTGAADHVQGFANFYNGSEDPMTRAQNETGVGETMGARMFTKMVQMGSYEVTGSVTRQQLQDMPLYGVDVVGQVLEAMQNEISQHINNRILDRVFKLGVENYKIQREYQGVDCNLYMNNSSGVASKKLINFAAASNYKDLNGDSFSVWGANWGVPNSIQNTSAENVMTNQRRIFSRCLYAKHVIANTSRRGFANWIVTNFTMLTALMDNNAFVINPALNTLTQDNNQSLYFAGSVMGMNVYVDPYMKADDNRICVGRKSDGKTPGVIFMPYILADTIQTIVEGTMAPKLLVNSRYALVDAGFYPEQNYYTFMVDSGRVPAGHEPVEANYPSGSFEMFI